MNGGLTFEITRDVDAARALRRSVFVEEMGISASIEADEFDAGCEHAILRDPARPSLGVIGTARLARGVRYTKREFDLSGLEATGAPVTELGRTCLHPAYRGGTAGLVMFREIASRLAGQGAAYLVGTASLSGTDPDVHMAVLQALDTVAAAPAGLRPRAHGAQAVRVSGSGSGTDLRQLPPLIKTYLRAGAWVGQDAWIDNDFRCIDICILLDMARLRLPGAQRLQSVGNPA